MISQLLHLPFPLGLSLIMLLPPWAGYLVLGLLVLGLISCGGFILARLGYKPLWALLMVIPVVQIAAYWALAFMRWPRDSTARQQD